MGKALVEQVTINGRCIFKTVAQMQEAIQDGIRADVALAIETPRFPEEVDPGRGGATPH